MAWLEFSVTIDEEAVESVAELFAQHGYQGGVVVEPPILPTRESDGWVGTPSPQTPAPPAWTPDPARPALVRTYVPDDPEAAAVRARIEQALWHLGQLRAVGPLQVRRLEEEDWANAWKQHYPVLRAGERLVVVPSWLEHTPAPDDVVLHLDPGMAFGTGLHPTTRLCLRLLESHARAGVRLLDVGCGSGILAIAAAKLGAAPVLAIDNDPVAVEVAQQNAARNDVSAQVAVRLDSLGAEPRPPHYDACYEVVVANIIADVLIATSRDLAAALVPGGTLISSGIIDHREDEVALMLAAAGLRLRARHTDGDWVALVHTRQ